MYRITPKPGAPIRDPVTLKLIPPEGFVAERVTAYWRRRADEGGVKVTNESAGMGAERPGDAGQDRPADTGRTADGAAQDAADSDATANPLVALGPGRVLLGRGGVEAVARARDVETGITSIRNASAAKPDQKE